VEPYADPLWTDLDALEHSPGPFDPAIPVHQDLDQFMDPLGEMLTSLENEIEGTTIPPPFEPEPLVLPAETFGPTSQGPTSEGPPPPPESVERPWITLQPAPAARPSFSHDGLASPSYRPQRAGGTGIRNEGASKMPRLCPETNGFVDEERSCQTDCGKYRDWGAGFEQCYHDWLEDQENDQDQSDDERRQVEE